MLNNIKYKLNKNYILLFIILAPLTFLFLVNYVFESYIHHDSLLMFLNYKYLYNYISSYSDIPLWTDYIYGGTSTAALYLYDLPKIYFPSLFIGKLLNLNSYSMFLINMSIINSIFIFGLYKVYLLFRFTKIIFLVCSILFLFSNFIQKGYSANLEVFLFFPYVFYYTYKFTLNKKINELIKTSRIVFICYINSIQYFSIFFIYFSLLFIIFLFIFNLKLDKKFFYKLKLKHILEIFVLISLSVLYFYKIENIIFDNYLVPERIGAEDTKKFFLDNILYGYHNILIKYIVFVSNFFWWDVPLTTSFFGIFLIAFFFLSKANKFNKNFRISLFLFSILIITISETLIFNEIVKIFSHLPFLNYFRHFSFVNIYLKPLFIILMMFGASNYFYHIEEKNYKYLLKFKLIFIFVIIISFILNYCILDILSSGNQPFEKNVFGIYYILNNALNYLNVNDYFGKIDLFRGLRKQLLDCFAINLFCFCIFYLIFFFKKSKLSNFNLFFIVIITSIPSVIYNYANYSLNNNINLFTNYKNTNQIKENYKKIILNDSNFKKTNSLKKCSNKILKNEIFNLDKSIPKFSIFYENIFLFTSSKPCFSVLRWDFLNKNYQKNKLDYLHFKNLNNYEKINNENFLIKPTSKEIFTNINYSEFWKLRNYKGNNAIIENYNGKIKITNINSKSKNNIHLYYENKNIYFIFIFSTLIGFFLLILFFFSLKKCLKS